jgi:hypothetical protein
LTAIEQESVVRIESGCGDGRHPRDSKQNQDQNFIQRLLFLSCAPDTL